MIVKLLRRIVLLSGILLLSMSVFGQAVFAAPPNAAPPGGHLNITEVFVTFGPPDTLTIMGEDFGFGPGPLVVTLGDFDPLTIVSATPTTIVVNCPPDGSNIPTCLDGDFLLTASNGNGQSQNDEYDLTIGAVGLQGDKGDKGDKGDTGDTGVSGLHRVGTGFQPTSADSVSPKTAVASCPVGEKALGGGYSLSGGGSNLAVRVNAPQFDPPTGWVVTAVEVNPTSITWQVQAFAVCANVN